MIRLDCDYLEGCHPSILEALQRTNLEKTPGYGLDPYCEQAADAIRAHFGCPEAAVHFLTGGTQVNATVIAAGLRPYEGVLCADTGHIHVHETGAVEATGHKCLPLPSRNGKITASQVNVAVALQADFEHTVKPGMVYISQPTEFGTLYSLTELKDLFITCQQLGLYLYIDGARLGYGLASRFNDITAEDLAQCCDAFTVGGTKVGAMFGEALVITNPELNRDFRYMIKRSGAMLAKGRMLGIQFLELMREGRYTAIAAKAVEQADRIRRALLNAGIELYIDSPTNQLFPILSDDQLETLEEEFVLSVWERLDENHSIVRVCTSWATPEADVEAFIAAVGKLSA